MIASSKRSGRGSRGHGGRSGGKLQHLEPATSHGIVTPRGSHAAQQPLASRGALRNQHRHAARKKEVEEGLQHIQREVGSEVARVQSELGTQVKDLRSEIQAHVSDLKSLILELARPTTGDPKIGERHHVHSQVELSQQSQAFATDRNDLVEESHYENTQGADDRSVPCTPPVLKPLHAPTTPKKTKAANVRHKHRKTSVNEMQAVTREEVQGDSDSSPADTFKAIVRVEEVEPAAAAAANSNVDETEVATVVAVGDHSQIQQLQAHQSQQDVSVQQVPRTAAVQMNQWLGKTSSTPKEAGQEADYAKMICDIYQMHAPEEVDKGLAFLKKYAGYERQLYKDICRRYGVQPVDDNNCSEAVSQPLREETAWMDKQQLGMCSTGTHAHRESQHRALQSDGLEISLFTVAQDVEIFCPAVFGDDRPGFLTDAESDQLFKTCQDFAELGRPLDSEEESSELEEEEEEVGDVSIKRMDVATCTWTARGNLSEIPKGQEVDEYMAARQRPAALPDGKPWTCSTCPFPISSGEFQDGRQLSCPCGATLCFACQEKGRQCRCGGVGELYKTRPCRLFSHGCCKYGKNCAFAHGSEELRFPQGYRIAGDTMKQHTIPLGPSSSKAMPKIPATRNKAWLDETSLLCGGCSSDGSFEDFHWDPNEEY